MRLSTSVNSKQMQALVMPKTHYGENKVCVFFQGHHGSLGKKGVKIRVPYELKLNSIEVGGAYAKQNEHMQEANGAL